MSCARCGCGIYKTEEFISLNKVWHKYCFTCYQCSKRLDKDCAKIFQGELFCECCYRSVIEKLFEVISTPSVNKPCKVVSTPSCAVTKNCQQKSNNCGGTCLQQSGCRYNEYCFPADKKPCRTVQSCSCIPSQQLKNEHCFPFPIPREVANYYNRSHMRTKGCKNPITCCSLPQCPACSCRKTCCPVPKDPIQVRILRNQCCCNSCILRSGCSSPCPPPPQCHQCCQKRCCKPKCSPNPCCPQEPCCQSKCCPGSKCSPPGKCCPPVKCCPPAKCCTPPGCPPPKWCPPPRQCCPPKSEGCCENFRCCYKRPTTYCCQSQKYCICGNLNPCNCKMSQIRTQCTACCNRCGQKVYAAEKVLVSCGAYHTSCFTCYCCKKCLDVKNVYEGCGEIYCKQCYNHFFGIQYYGFGRPNC